MSRICGVWHFGETSPSPEDEFRVRTALASRGYSSPQIHRDAEVVAGWAAGGEAPRTRGFVPSPQGDLCLWDGRIDNLAGLLKRTGLQAHANDDAIALHLYRKQGVDGLAELVGDWSLCLWEAKHRRIVLAADYAGNRPLFYHRSVHSLCWSSALADLVGWTGITKLDDDYVAGFLGQSGSGSYTPYAGILGVPPGHAITVDGEGIQIRSFFTFRFDREIVFADEREYEERLREIFAEAVRMRIPSGPTASIELSGGFDSSSVVCMANQLRKSSIGAFPDPVTFSYTSENSIDEKFFLEVERACGLTAYHFELRECPLTDAGIAGVVPAWWEPRFRQLDIRMAAIGAGVLLTGQFGDLIMGNTADSTSQVAEWLSKYRIVDACREAYGWARADQVPVYPILWQALREAWLSWVPSMSPDSAPGAMRTNTDDSLTGALRARAKSAEPSERPWRHVPPGRRRLSRAVSESLQSGRLKTPEALQHWSYSHPYAHRPLVEFMLAIPPRIALGPNQPRRLMRRAFADLLPPLVLNRRSKGDYARTFREATAPLAAELLRRPDAIQLVARGYLDRASLLSRLHAFTQGLDCNAWQLQSVILLEFWLRNRMG